MKLKVIASGSSGNCYILENDKEALIIEAGVPFSEVKKALDYNVMKIVGVISSHGHNDHNKYLERYKNAGISSWCFGKELPEYEEEKMKHYVLGMGKFRIKPFPLVHDVPCYGFYITHPDIGKLVFVTDTEYCKYRFKGLNHILVEANYDEDCCIYWSYKEHVLTGHMSIQTTERFISTNDNPDLRTVCLIHLSDANASKTAFKEKIQKLTAANVYVAQPKLNIELSLPF